MLHIPTLIKKEKDMWEYLTIRFGYYERDGTLIVTHRGSEKLFKQSEDHSPIWESCKTLEEFLNWVGLENWELVFLAPWDGREGNWIGVLKRAI